MFRFTIRDVLWLTSLVAVLVAGWQDHVQVKRERAEMARIAATLTAEKNAALKSAKRQNLRVEQISRDAGRVFSVAQAYGVPVEKMRGEGEPPLRSLSEAEIEAAKRSSAELGAPQAKPLPAGYGEKPNEK